MVVAEEIADLPDEATDQAPRALPTDTLAHSVLVLLVLTVLQRLVGFVRGLLFCRWLAPEELGEWEMCFNFLMLAAPLAILSLPGAFGRYLEHYRVRGQFRLFLRRTSWATCLLAGLASWLLWSQRPWFSKLIFGRDDYAELVGWLGAALVAVIALNFTTDLFTALRLQRVASRLQTIHTFAFAVLGVALVAWQARGAQSVVIAYGAAALVAFVAAWPMLWRAWQVSPISAEQVSQVSFWSKLAPYAVSLWFTNWLSNLFAMVDRHLIIHYSGLRADDALALVGQYHSARLVPMLIFLFAGTLGASLLPYLSHDWEAGRQQAVSQRLSLVLKVLSLSLAVIGVVVLWAAPPMFDLVFHGKYAAGLAILPCTLAYCTWAGIGCVARTYLWCRERVALTGLAYCAGLLTSVGLNLWLLPCFGLPGAVWGTTVGNVVTLVVILALSRWQGMELAHGSYLAMLLPMALGCGTWIATPVVLAALVLAWKGSLLFSPQEKSRLREVAGGYLRKLRPIRRSSHLA